MFSKHKLFTVIFTCIYFPAVVLGHELASKVSVWVEKKLTRVVYNEIIAIAGIVLVIISSAFVLRKIKRANQKTLKIIYWSLTIILVVISFRTLMVNNIEGIHFPQYAILALPVFALTKSFGETVFWITLLGAIDEGHQYFILYHYANDIYFDFNDIILNLLGGGIGIMLIYTFGMTDRARWSKTPFIITSVILLGSLALYASGLLQFYPESASKAPILLSRVPAPEQFWINLKWGKTYHVLSPFEGTLFAVMLICVYAFLDFKIYPKFSSLKKRG